MPRIYFFTFVVADMLCKEQAPIFDPEDGGSKLHQNCDERLTDCTISYPRRRYSTFIKYAINQFSQRILS
jgi:hypothetical protein